MIEISQVSSFIAIEDTEVLRRIAGVVGGKFDDGDLMVRRVQNFLDRLRSAINRVVTHSGFSSSGNLTDALNHPSFIEFTNTFENGLILEQLATYDDPTGVLSGAQEIISTALDTLKYVYKSESTEVIMARAHGRDGQMFEKIANKTRFNTRTVGPTMSIGSTVGTGTAAAVGGQSLVSTLERRLVTNSAGRSFITGPRTVIKNVAAGEGAEIKYSSHYDGKFSREENSNLRGVVARFAIVGVPSDKSGSVGFVDNVGTLKDRGAGQIIMGQPSDTTIAHLFHVPRTLGALRAAAGLAKWLGESVTLTHPTSTCLGFPDTAVLIPLTGLQDFTTGGRTNGGLNGSLEGFAGEDGVSQNNDYRENSSMVVGFDGDDALESTIDADVLISLAVSAGLVSPTYDVCVFDVVSLMEYTYAASGTEVESLHSFTVNSQVTKDAVPRNASAVLRSRVIDASVSMVREFYDDSEYIKRAKAYSRYCITQGRNDPTMVLYRGMLSEQVRKNLSILGSGFRSANGGAAQLLANVTAADFATGLSASTLISGSVLDLFMRPLSSNTWIGPNKVPETMVMLDEVRKFGLFRRWTKILDYVVLESMLDIEFNRNYSDE